MDSRYFRGLNSPLAITFPDAFARILQNGRQTAITFCDFFTLSCFAGECNWKAEASLSREHQIFPRRTKSVVYICVLWLGAIIPSAAQKTNNKFPVAFPAAAQPKIQPTNDKKEKDCVLPDAPTPASGASTLSDPPPVPLLTTHHRPAASAGTPPWLDTRTADLKFHLLIGSLAASTSTDIELTMRCEWAHSCAYVPVSLRRRRILYGIAIPSGLAVTYFTYKLKKHRISGWWIPAAVLTGANTYIALHALHRLNQ